MRAFKTFVTSLLDLLRPRNDILVDASSMQIHDIIPRIMSKIERGYRFVITLTNRWELYLLTTYEIPVVA